jgi:hypothetical protein
MGALRFRPLPCHPFTDVGRTIPEFRSVCLTESKEFHGFSVGKKNILKIDGEAARFLFQYAPKHVDMFPCNAAADEQHQETFRANDSIDSAAHSQLLTHSSTITPPSGRDYLQTKSKTTAIYKLLKLKENLR